MSNHYHHTLRYISVTMLVTVLPTTQARLLNDTGVSTCSTYDENGLPCPIDDFPNQDAEHGTNKFYFTKIDTNGQDLPASATQHTCVRDNVTNLFWEVKTDDSGLHDQDWTYTWYNSNSPGGNPGTANGGYCLPVGRCDTEKFVKDVNDAGLCNFHDWRLPTEKELVGIIDYTISYHGPVVPVDYFPNTLSTWFWTQSSYGTISNSAWIVFFYTGAVDKDFRNGKHSVRLVRGPLNPNSFTVQTTDASLIDDATTDLTWKKAEETTTSQKCAVGMTWGDALRSATAANAAKLGGNEDWRLPNIKELQSIVDYDTRSPSAYTDHFNFYATYFGATDWFWSSTPHAYGPDYAWGVKFDYGFISNHSRYDCLRVRLVSGPQPFLGNTGRVFLESPLPDSFESGIGLIRGWACEASKIEVQIDTSRRYRVAYGTRRSDTQAICNDVDNGFGVTFNWNSLGDGTHVLKAFADDVEFANVNFVVTTLDLGVEYPLGLSGEYVLQHFPVHGRDATVRWAEPHQNFRIIGVSKQTAVNTIKTAIAPATAMLESPQQESFESGIGLIRGWICTANVVEVQIDNGPKIKVGYGTLRGDTKTVCNDDGNNGFGLTYNWGNLSMGQHKLRAYADDAKFAEVDFAVTNLGTPFLRDIRAEYVLPNFPHLDDETKIRWAEPHQNFVIVP